MGPPAQPIDETRGRGAAKGGRGTRMARRSDAERDERVVEQLRRNELPLEWRDELEGADGDTVLLMFWLDAMARRVQAIHHEEVRGEGLSSSESMVLYHLLLAGAPYRQSPTRINQKLELSSGGVTKTIDRLVARGFVHRERDAGDGRSIQVVLTEEGRRKARRVVSAFNRRYGELVTPLTRGQLRDAVCTMRLLLDSFGARL